MDINTIINLYNSAKEQEREAKKQAEKLKAMILNHASGSELFETENYIVMIQKRISTRIDTETLYKDFPDFKETYGKQTVSEIITTKAKQTVQKTA